MARWTVVMALASMIGATPALAIDAGRATGTLTTAQGATSLSHAYAMQYFNEEGLADGPELRLLLTDRPVDQDLLSGPLLTALERAVRKGAVKGIVLRLDPKELNKVPVRGTLLLPPPTPREGLHFFTVAGDSGGLESLKIGGNRVTGKAVFKSNAPSASAFAYEATFSAPLFKDDPSGRLIGRKAVESPPAQALLSFERAVRLGDLVGASGYATPARMAEIDAFQSAVGPAAFLEEVAAGTPDSRVREQQIQEVVLRGKQAYVIIVEESGRTVARLVHSQGTWQVD
jgi:hypothetical protein